MHVLQNVKHTLLTKMFNSLHQIYKGLQITPKIQVTNVTLILLTKYKAKVKN